MARLGKLSILPVYCFASVVWFAENAKNLRSHQRNYAGNLIGTCGDSPTFDPVSIETAEKQLQECSHGKPGGAGPRGEGLSAADQSSLKQ